MTITDLVCPIVKVSNAGAEDGLYEVREDIRVKWAEERQVYKNSDSDRCEIKRIGSLPYNQFGL